MFNKSREQSPSWTFVTAKDVKWLAYLFSECAMIILNMFTIRIIPSIKSLPPFIIKLIISLAIADCTLGFSGLSRNFYVLFKQESILTDRYCSIDVFFIHVCCMSSLLHMNLITIFKFLSIRRPFCLEKIERFCIPSIVAVWLIVLAFCIEILVDKGVSRYEYNSYICQYNVSANALTILKTLISLFVPAIVALISDVNIYLLVRKQTKRIQEQNSERNHPHSPVINFKTIKTMFVLHFGILIAWTPYLFLSIIPEMISGRPIKSAHFYVTYIAISNSFWNPLIYWYTVKEFRRKFVSIFNFSKSC